MNNTLSVDSEKSFSQVVAATVSRLDNRTVIALGGMLCISSIICLGCIVYSGYEMSLSSSGLSIKRHVDDE